MASVKFHDGPNFYHSRQGRWLQHPALPAFASALLAVMLYAVTLGGTYVYDDQMVVREDPRVHHPDQWIKLWTTDYYNGGVDNLYRPIVSSSYAIEWFLHGDRPWIFHGINVLLHALAAAGVAEFTRRALGGHRISRSAALAAGLLFAAHPVHVEAVANIVGRAELLCTACIFLGLIWLCRRPLTIRRGIGIIAIGIVGMLSKEQGILQPLLWLFVVLFVWQPSTRPNPGERQALKIFVLLTTWIWAGYLVGREHFLRFEWDRSAIDPYAQPLLQSHGLDRVLMPVVLIGHYTALLLWPSHLSADYGSGVIGSVAHFTDPYLWFGFLAISFWIGAILFCLNPFQTRRHGDTEKTEGFNSSPCLRVSVFKKFILFCLPSLAVTYSMVGNILTLIATIFAERLIYLPSAFFLMIVGTLIAFIPIKPRSFLLSIILILASIRTITGARDWNHPTTLYHHSLLNQPESAQLRILLSRQYREAGDIPAAMKMLKEACDLYPDYWWPLMFRANLDMDTGDLADADSSVKRAIKLKADPRLIPVAERLEKLKAATRPGSARGQN